MKTLPLLLLAGGLCCLMSSCEAIHKWTAPKSQAVQAVPLQTAIGAVGGVSAGEVSQAMLIQGDPFDLALGEAGRSLFNLTRKEEFAR
jgi:hypothetical protein